jgi:hypothetical protein
MPYNRLSQVEPEPSASRICASQLCGLEFIALLHFEILVLNFKIILVCSPVLADVRMGSVCPKERKLELW